MKTKALILAALPVPMKGMWITIGEAEKWKTLVRTEPLGVDVSEIVTIEVLLTNGLRTERCKDGLEISGVKARVVIEKSSTACKYVSVNLEEVES